MHYAYLIFVSGKRSCIGIGATIALIWLFGCFFKKDFTSSNVIDGSSSLPSCVSTHDNKDPRKLGTWQSVLLGQ